MSFATYPKNVTFLSISFLFLPLRPPNDNSLIGHVRGRARKKSGGEDAAPPSPSVEAVQKSSCACWASYSPCSMPRQGSDWSGGGKRGLRGAEEEAKRRARGVLVSPSSKQNHNKAWKLPKEIKAQPARRRGRGRRGWRRCCCVRRGGGMGMIVSVVVAQAEVDFAMSSIVPAESTVWLELADK